METNTEHTCSWASNKHSATAMSVSVYCGVSFMNIPSREQQTIYQCVLTCVCIWSCVMCVLNDIFRRTTKATQGGKWMGKSARLFMQPWQHNNETHSLCAPVQPVTSAPLAAQRPPLALRSHWEERHAERESDGAVLLSVASPDSIHPPLPLLEFIGCAQLWHSLKSTHYPDICTHHMQN